MKLLRNIVLIWCVFFTIACLLIAVPMLVYLPVEGGPYFHVLVNWLVVLPVKILMNQGIYFHGVSIGRLSAMTIFTYSSLATLFAILGAFIARKYNKPNFLFK